jgi:hypothetical protein
LRPAILEDGLPEQGAVVVFSNHWVDNPTDWSGLNTFLLYRRD